MQSARASSSRIRRIGGSSSSSVDIKKSQGSLPQLSYAQRLSFYTLPPVEEVGVDEFIQFASDRLTVLREIDTSRIRGLGAEEIENRVKASCMKHLPLHTNKRSDIRKDVISHFVLRLAFCTTPESRKWFLKQECELLRFRLTSDNTDIAKFLEENGMSETQVTRAEFQQYEQEIRACHPIKKQDKCSAIYYYKVRFTDVLNLVARRSTFLRGGYAYIYRDDLISVVQNNYRQHLSKELTKAYRAEAMIRKDERISAILNGLARGREQSMSQTYDANQRQVNPLQLEFLSRQSFPLCAQNMHRQLKRTHHLKHWARVQHGLFLKAVGLPLEGALEFWRTEFCKEVGMDTTTFDRKYAYNFRHLYGKEGKRCDWSPYGCGRIITQFKNPGEGEYHGCPYQTMDAEHLRIALEQTMRERPHVSAQQTLENWDEMRKGINEIVQLATDGHYQACISDKDFIVSLLCFYARFTVRRC